MLRFDYLNALHGDSALVHWGDNKRMLVDGGPQTVFKKRLRPHLLGLAGGPGQPVTLDVVCVTHVDEDHIVGVQELLKEVHQTKNDQLPPTFRIKRLWHNSVEELVDTVEPGLSASTQAIVKQAEAVAAVGASFNQGRDVRNRAVALNIQGNLPFNGAVKVGAKATIDGLDVTIVAPDQKALDNLAKKWRAAKLAKDSKVISQAFADRAVPNLSSIAMLLQAGGHSALLTGDARGDHVLTGLEEAGIVKPGEVLAVNLLQVPHHGSENNVAAVFFERIKADHYVISTDGVKHDTHPGADTLRWLVESRDASDVFTIHVTNKIKAEGALKVLKELRQDASRKFTVVEREDGDPGITVTLE